MPRKIWFVILLALAVFASSAEAQYQRRPMQPVRSGGMPEHKIEISPYGGYAWTTSYDVRYRDLYGSLDIKNSSVWGIALDVNLRPGKQLELLYHRQDSDLIFKEQGSWEKTNLGGIAVEYWHIGGVAGFRRDNVMPFASATLGLTRFHPKTNLAGDEYRFSMILGLGAKLYANERLGIRIQGRMPWTILDGGASIFCGGGGCYTSIGGYGIAQFELSGGLFLMF
jgi:hypothetical protein